MLAPTVALGRDSSMTKHAGGALLPSIVIDRASATPLGAQLAHALRKLIVTAVLRPGDRLPSSRTLAADLGLSRTTVVDVYDQLTAEGLIASRVGDGAYVSAGAVARPARPAAPAGRRGSPASPARPPSGSSRASPTRACRAPSSPAPRPTTPSRCRCGRSSPRRCSAARVPRLMRYPEAGGLPGLREAIAGHLRMNRGIACAAEEVFVFQGAQDAFGRIAALLLDPGDLVWFENPGHIGARNALTAAGARLVPVPVDDDGLDVAAGRAAAPAFRLAFVTPSHQQPLAVAMSLERRRALIAAAERADAWIVEDDAVGDLCFAGRPPPALRSLDRSGRVIHVGSFAQVAVPRTAARLRAGAAGPRRGLRARRRRHPAGRPDAAAGDARRLHRRRPLRRPRPPDAQALRRAPRRAPRRRRPPARRPLRGAPHPLRPRHRRPPAAADADEEAIAAAAAARGVSVAPLSRFCLAPVPGRALALGFAAVPPRDIAAGIDALAAALHETRAR